MQIEVLFFRGCPHHQPTVDLAREVAAELELTANVQEVEVRDHEEAVRLRFAGSPSVRVDGIDIEPGADERTDWSLSCRMYGRSGVPPRELLAAALQRRG